jgi:hypothetical protein
LNESVTQPTVVGHDREITTSYTSSQMFTVARVEAHRSNPSQNDALVGIIFSALAIEAFINDLMELCEVYSRMGDKSVSIKTFVTLLKQAEESRASIELKLHLASVAFRGAAFDRGISPYQDFNLLFKLRNTLVHAKPDTIILENGEYVRKAEGVEKILSALESRNLISNEPGQDFFTIVTTSAVVTWAHEVAVKVTRNIVDLITDMDHKGSLEKIVAVIHGGGLENLHAIKVP